jgi:hypothetical protein
MNDKCFRVISHLTKDCRLRRRAARECLHRMKALQGSTEDKGEAACTVWYSNIPYVISQEGGVSEVRTPWSDGIADYRLNLQITV